MTLRVRIVRSLRTWASLAQLIGAVHVRVCARTLSRSHETAESPPVRNLKRRPSVSQDEDNDAENRVFVGRSQRRFTSPCRSNAGY